MEIVNFIVSDDIRTEGGGKQILIGVFGGPVNVVPGNATPTLPVSLKLCFYVSLKKPIWEQIPNIFTASFSQEGYEFPTLTGIIDKPEQFNKNTSINLTLQASNFPIYKTGRIKCRIDFKAGDTIVDTIEHEGFNVVLLPPPQAEPAQPVK